MRTIPEHLITAPFTLSQAAEAGVGRAVLRGQRFATPWRGVREAAGLPPDLYRRCLAARLVLPEHSALSHLTAVRLHGLPEPLVFGQRPTPGVSLIDVTVPSGAPRPRRAGLRAHRLALRPGDIMKVADLPVTTPERTWLDLAANGATLVELVVLADAIRRRDPDAVSRLTQQLASSRGARGVVLARRAFGASRDGVDSAMETRLRLILIDGGLPEPEVNRWVCDANGERVHRPDLSWGRWRVAADYDGEHHHARDQLQDVASGLRTDRRRRLDLGRQELLRDIDWDLRVFTSYDVLRTPRRTVDRMRTTLRAAGASI